MAVVPYKNKLESKKVQVAEMFNNISARYDFLNHFLSAGIDILWRKKAIRLLRDIHPEIILDVACGTGDFSLAALKLKPKKIYGLDISSGMLEVGKTKIESKGLSDKIELQLGDSEDIKFEDEYFDAITVGFGVRNFEHLEKGLNEMNRVLRKGGKAAILEFSKPKNFPIKQIYQFYFNKILPTIGKTISKDSTAYTYLPESVNAFPEGKEFVNILQKCNFENVKTYSLFFGIASIYIGEK